MLKQTRPRVLVHTMAYTCQQSSVVIFKDSHNTAVPYAQASTSPTILPPLTSARHGGHWLHQGLGFALHLGFSVLCGGNRAHSLHIRFWFLFS